MFNIGDKVAYPMHGAGVIEGVEEQKILGEEHKYYVLKLFIGNVKVMIPTANIEEIGVRSIVSSAEADDVIGEFKSYDGTDVDSNWNKRYRDNVEKLKIGILTDVAHITKSLLVRDKQKSLSNAERKMLSNAKNALISELGLAKNMAFEDIESLLLEGIS